MVVAFHRASSHSMARIAERPGHSLPGSYEGLHRHSRAHQAIAAAAGSSLSALRRWHKQGCAGTALQPCPAHGYPCVPAPGGLCPHSLCTTGLSLGAAVHLQCCPLSLAPAPHTPLPGWMRLGWPGCRGPSRNVEAMAFHGLGASSAPAWASQHWEDPAPSSDVWFPPVPRHPSQHSLMPALSKPPRILPAAQPHACPVCLLATTSCTSGTNDLSGGAAVPLGAPAACRLHH